jgi:hypothetical protein
MPMNKTLFPEVIKDWDYRPEPGLNFRSIYGNTVHKGKGIRNNTEKFTVFQKKPWPVIAKQVEAALFMAVNDSGLNIVTKAFLRSEFTEQSIYEKSVPDLIEIGKGCNKRV